MPPQQRLGRVLLNHHHLHAAAAAEPPNQQQKMPAKGAQLHKQKEEYGGIMLPLHRRLLEDALQALLLQQRCSLARSPLQHLHSDPLKTLPTHSDDSCC
jgi:hypothetical protein